MDQGKIITAEKYEQDDEREKTMELEITHIKSEILDYGEKFTSLSAVAANNLWPEMYKSLSQ